MSSFLYASSRLLPSVTEPWFFMITVSEQRTISRIVSGSSEVPGVPKGAVGMPPMVTTISGMIGICKSISAIVIATACGGCACTIACTSGRSR
ncbi:MAG: hypothetical protein R3F17_11665 [Planctomycetota bacterium]